MKKVIFILLLLSATVKTVCAQGTVFNYQGHLFDNDLPENGSYDFRCVLFDGPTNVFQFGNIVTNASVIVTNGLFALNIDFGEGVFTGEPRWLEIGVRTNGDSNIFTTLTPRQQMLPTPYAIHAGSASSLTAPIGDDMLPGGLAHLGTDQTFTGTINFSPSAGAPFAVSNAKMIKNLNAEKLGGLTADGFWKRGGNFGTASGADFLGTIDDQPLEFRVRNQRALRLEPGTSTPNAIFDGFVGIGTTAPFRELDVVGDLRLTTAFPFVEFVSTDWSDPAYIRANVDVNSSTHGDYLEFTTPKNKGFLFFQSSVGPKMVIDPAGNVGIGTSNPGPFKVSIDGSFKALNNTADSEILIYNPPVLSDETHYFSALYLDATHCNIPAGVTDNGYRIGLSAQGYVEDPAFEGTLNYQYGVWARHGAYKSSHGTINNSYGVFIDSLTDGSTTFGNLYGLYQDSRAAKNYFAGDLGIGTSSPTARLEVGGQNPKVRIWQDQNTPGEALLWLAASGGQDKKAKVILHNVTLESAAGDGGDYLRIQNKTKGDINGDPLAYFAANGAVGIGTDSPASKLDVRGDITCTSVIQTSDRNAKENFGPIDPAEVLEKLNTLPLMTWNYKTQDPAVRHLGPMAQDFRAAFGLGQDDKHINNVDVDGVEIAAIQRINQLVTEQKRELAAKEKRVTALESKVAELEKALSLVLNERSGGVK
jgi:hypothetical protein